MMLDTEYSCNMKKKFFVYMYMEILSLNEKQAIFTNRFCFYIIFMYQVVNYWD